jgi:deoxycytidine triphosphate deaminase
MVTNVPNAPSSRLIVGDNILTRNLIRDGNKGNLKNSSYDLSIGEIFPVGDEGAKLRGASEIKSYVVRPREAVWLLSKEEFDMQSNTSGLAYLRTTFTRKGLFALNTGVIDPHYKGPISTILLNFSKEKIEVHKGEKFFRIMFFEHDDVSDWKPKKDESMAVDPYRKELAHIALNHYSPNFLDIPEFDRGFYVRTATKMLLGLVRTHWIISFFVTVFFLAPLIYVYTLPDYWVWFDSCKEWFFGAWKWISTIWTDPGASN